MKYILKFVFYIVAIIFIVECGGNNSSTSNTLWYKPTKDTTWQWQLTGKLNLSYDVDIYDIDLFDTPKKAIDKLHQNNKKVICYFSAGSYEEWREDASKFPNSILGKELDGWEGEKWLDIRQLDILEDIMNDRLDLAKDKGCDGVEVDNIDGYSNDTGFDITSDDQLQYNIFLANQAHQRGLSIGLKNDLAQIKELEEKFDFAVNEQCHYYNECDMLQPFLDHNKPVFHAEYDSRYIINNEASSQLCQDTNQMGLKTLVLPMDLDDTFRYSCDSKDRIINEFKTGFGGGSAFKFQNDDNNLVWVSAIDLMIDSNIGEDSYYQSIKNFDKNKFKELQSHLVKTRYFTMWLTKGWDESWVDADEINRAIKAGKVPVFVYWYFGDRLAEGMPSSDEIKLYHEDNKRLKILLDKVQGEKLLILEPEFNKQVVLDNAKEFSDIISDAIDILKSDNTLVSLCMTDTGNRGEKQTYDKCGYSNCALGDKYEWRLSQDIYNALLDKLDFVSFQEMLGEFSRDPSNPGTWDDPNPKSYTDEQIGINYLPKRLENLSAYMYELYHKPVYLPYIAIATASWEDKNDNGKIDNDEIDKSGYETKASKFYQDINQTALRANHLFGYSIMELFDEPRHDYGGYQFFINNEYHLGIIKSSAKDEEDKATNGDIEFKIDLKSIYQK